MAEFYFALLAFYLGHSIPPRRPVRAYIVSVIGERGYRIWYSILSLILLGWLIVAAIHAPRVALWGVQPWMAWLALIAMAFVSVLAVPGFAQANPLSIGLSGGTFDPKSPGVVAITRHPVLWCFGLWALCHIPVNGQEVWVVLFGLLGLFAFAGMAFIDAKRKRDLGPEAWKELARGTSVIPFAAIVSGRARFPTDRKTLMLMVLGGWLYVGILFWLHETLIGVAPLDRL